MGLINRKPVDEEFVSLREIAREVGCDPKTVRNRINDKGWHFPIERKFKDEVVSYLKELKKTGWDKPLTKPAEAEKPAEEPEAEPKIDEKAVPEEREPEKEQLPDTVFNSKQNYGYHVSIRGRLGWVVIHVGPYEEMESWARLLRKNDFEAKVEENQRMLLAYDVALNKERI